MARGLAVKTQRLVDDAIVILEEIQPAGVRAVCYQLFVRGRKIPSMGKNDTGRVSHHLTRARERGEIPWEWIVDETRPIHRSPGWANPERYLVTVNNSYRRNRWRDQPERLLIVSEKATVGGVLQPVIDEWGVNFTVAHGFNSASNMREIADLSTEDWRPLTILYVGDHDPSGRFMSDVDLPGRVGRYGGDVRIERIAVTQQQIAGESLPTFSADEKRTDARYAWFVARFGRVCCELDALNPVVLREAIEDAISAHVNLYAWEQTGSTEAAELGSLRAFFAAWPGAMAS